MTARSVLPTADEPISLENHRSTQPRARATGGVALNTLILTAGQVVGRLQGLIFIPFISRSLGSADLGAYQLGNVFVGYFLIVVLFGMSPLIVRAMVQRSEEMPRIFVQSLGFRILIATASICALGLMLILLNYPTLVVQVTVILSFGLIATAITDISDCVFQATERMYYSIAIVCATALPYIAAGWLVLHSGYGVEGLAAISTVIMMVRAAISLLIVHTKFFKFKFTLDLVGQRYLLSAALPFFLGGIAASFVSKIGVFILSQMKPLEVVGIYVAGYFFLDLSLFVANSFAQAIYPPLSRAATQSKEALGDLTRLLFRIMTAISLLIIVAVVPLAPQLVRFLYGDAFQASVPVLQVVIWSLVLVGYNNTIGRAIYSAGGQWPLVAVNAIAAISNVLLNVLLIPPLGLVGCSIATVASFGVAVAAHGYVAPRFGCAVDLRSALRTLPALLAGLVTGWALADWFWPAALVAAPLTSVVGLLMVGYVRRQDVEALGIDFGWIIRARRQLAALSGQ